MAITTVTDRGNRWCFFFTVVGVQANALITYRAGQLAHRAVNLYQQLCDHLDARSEWLTEEDNERADG